MMTQLYYIYTYTHDDDCIIIIILLLAVWIPLLSCLLYFSSKLTGICLVTHRVGLVDLVTLVSETLLTSLNCKEKVSHIIASYVRT